MQFAVEAQLFESNQTCEQENQIIKFNFLYGGKSPSEFYNDIVELMSLIKLLQIGMFFEFLVNYLQQKKKRRYYVKLIQVVNKTLWRNSFFI